MKNAIVMFSLMGLMFAGCEMEGHREQKEGEKNGEMKKEMPAKTNGNGQMQQTPGMER
jgi:hypothetical protein